MKKKKIKELQYSMLFSRICMYFTLKINTFFTLFPPFSNENCPARKMERRLLHFFVCLSLFNNFCHRKPSFHRRQDHHHRLSLSPREVESTEKEREREREKKATGSPLLFSSFSSPPTERRESHREPHGGGKRGEGKEEEVERHSFFLLDNQRETLHSSSSGKGRKKGFCFCSEVDLA